MNRRQTLRGFTLIELMIVVVVIAILSAIALPAYQDSVRKSRRTAAKTAVLDLASREERFYTTNNAYSATAADLGYSALPAAVPDAATNYFQLSVTVDNTTSPPSFTATATAQGDQQNDGCGNFSVNALGVKTVSGALPVSTCW
ncbi:MAG: type IV pilin protein [Thiomonas sp.]